MLTSLEHSSLTGRYVNKYEQRIIPEHNAIILLNYFINDIQPNQFEPQGTLQEEDDSYCLEESGII